MASTTEPDTHTSDPRSLAELVAELAANLATVDPDAADFLVDRSWAEALIDLVPHHN